VCGDATYSCVCNSGCKYDSAPCGSRVSVLDLARVVFMCSTAHELNLYMLVFTNTQGDTTHSVAPSKCIHSSTQKGHMDMTGTGKQNSTIRISTGTHARLWAHACQSITPSHGIPLDFARIPQIAQYIGKKSPKQPYGKLAQSACNKGCAIGPARASRFVAQRMYEFQCGLAEAPTSLHSIYMSLQHTTTLYCLQAAVLLCLQDCVACASVPVY
jgi:hypothetical protein